MAIGEKTGGRQKGSLNKSTLEIKALAQAFGPAAIQRLAELAGFAVGDDGARMKGAESEATQVAATKELLDRGYGRAVQPVAGPDGEGPIVTEITYRWAAASDSEE